MWGGLPPSKVKLSLQEVQKEVIAMSKPYIKDKAAAYEHCRAKVNTDQRNMGLPDPLNWRVRCYHAKKAAGTKSGVISHGRREEVLP